MGEDRVKLTAFQLRTVALMEAMPRLHSTHCFRSAMHHLERAERLVVEDPAMAIFRAITAEEEAASGLIRCVAELKYPKANLLNPRDHIHKHAVFPFMEVVQLFVAQSFADHFQSFKLHIKEESGRTLLMLALDVKVDGQVTLAYPIPPLNFGMKNRDSHEPINYSYQINQLIGARGGDSIKAFLKAEANVRNRILYAGPSGYPEVEEVNK